MSSDPIEVLRELPELWRESAIGWDKLESGQDASRWLRTCADELESALASLSAPKPSGEWVLVPREPTDEMAIAFAEEWFSRSRPLDDPELEDAYAAMLAAAPKPSSVNDNAVAVNESAPVNDKPGSAEAVAWCPACEGAGWSSDVMENFAPVTCPDCAGSGRAEHSITANESASPRPEASAPVGVEDWRRLGGAQRFLDWNRKQAEPPVRIGWEHQVFEAALAQQPAAMDGAAPLTERQAVIVTGYTGVLCSSFDAFHADLEKRAGRPVLTHEMADFGWIKPLYRDDFLGLAGQQQGETP